MDIENLRFFFLKKNSVFYLSLYVFYMMLRVESCLSFFHIIHCKYICPHTFFFNAVGKICVHAFNSLFLSFSNLRRQIQIVVNMHRECYFPISWRLINVIKGILIWPVSIQSLFMVFILFLTFRDPMNESTFSYSPVFHFPLKKKACQDDSHLYCAIKMQMNKAIFCFTVYIRYGRFKVKGQFIS